MSQRNPGMAKIGQQVVLLEVRVDTSVVIDEGRLLRLRQDRAPGVKRQGRWAAEK